MAMLVALTLLVALWSTGCSSSNATAPLPADDPLVDAQWIGFRDGDSSWQEIDLPTDQVFNFTALVDTATNPEGRYTIMVVRADADQQRVTLFSLQSTLAETAELDFSSLWGNGQQGTVNIDLAGSMTDKAARIRMAEEGTSFYGIGGNTTFTLDAGTYDLLATQAANTGDYLPTHLVVRRDLTLAAGGTIDQTVNFSDAMDDTLFELATTDTITVNSAYLDFGAVYLLTANGTAATLGETATDGTVSFNFKRPTGGATVAGDVLLAHLSLDLDGDVSGEDQIVSYYEGFATTDSLTVTPVDAFDGTYDEQTVDSALLPGLTATAYAHAMGYTVQYSGVGAGIEYEVISFVSNGWFQGAGTVAFHLPDPRQASNWHTKWSIPADAVWEMVAVSAQAASDGLGLQQAANWFFAEKPALTDGQWFGSAANISYGSSQPMMALR